MSTRCTVTVINHGERKQYYQDFKQKFDPESVRDEAKDEVDKD